MDAIIIPLKPHSHFHFGEFKVDGNVALSTTSVFAHSDTLFSALINTYADAIGNADDFVDMFLTEKLNISSMFYYIKKGDLIIYLLPKPVFIDVFLPRDGNHKLRAGVKFVSLKVWEEGFFANMWFTNNDLNYKFIQNNEIALTSEEFEAFGLNNNDAIYNKMDIPKSPIRKSDDKDAIYYQTDLEIAAINGLQIGFYFLVQSENTRYLEKLILVLNIMSYSGIGGEKNNLGRQMGKPEVVDFNFKVKDPNNYCNISVLNPAGQDELNQIRFQQSFFRGGNEYSSDSDVKIVRMITEGALITSKDVKGNAPVLGTDREGHSLIRYGKAFLVPVKFDENGNS